MGAKIKTASFVAISAVFAIGGCGGELVADDDDALVDAGRGMTADGNATESIPDGGDGADVVVSEAGANGQTVLTRGADASSCFALPTNDCGEGNAQYTGGNVSAGDVFEQAVADCHMANGGCGGVYGNFDPEGCLEDLHMQNPDDAFVACMSTKFSSTRWTCFEGQWYGYGAVIECPSR